MRDRLIVASPCEGVRVVPARKRPVWIPELAVVGAVREQLPERYRAVVDLVIGSGLRQGEVFGLELDGLDFLRTRAVDMHQQLVSLSPEPLHLGPTKTAESERAVPLAQVTLDALAAHLAAFPAREVQIEDRTDERNPVTRGARLAFRSGPGCMRCGTSTPRR